MCLFSPELFFFFYIIFIYLPFFKKKPFEPQILIWYNRKPPRLPWCHCHWKPHRPIIGFPRPIQWPKKEHSHRRFYFNLVFIKNFFLVTQLLLCQQAEACLATPRPILLWVRKLGLTLYSSKVVLWASLCASLASKNGNNSDKQIHMHFTPLTLAHISWI